MTIYQPVSHTTMDSEEQSTSTTHYSYNGFFVTQPTSSSIVDSELVSDDRINAEKVIDSFWKTLSFLKADLSRSLYNVPAASKSQEKGFFLDDSYSFEDIILNSSVPGSSPVSPEDSKDCESGTLSQSLTTGELVSLAAALLDPEDWSSEGDGLGYDVSEEVISPAGSGCPSGDSTAADDSEPASPDDNHDGASGRLSGERTSVSPPSLAVLQPVTPDWKETDNESDAEEEEEVRLPADPTQWSKDDIQEWLTWICRKFSLRELDSSKFPDNGKDLCALTLKDFRQRTEDLRTADILLTFLASRKIDAGIIKPPNVDSPVSSETEDGTCGKDQTPYTEALRKSGWSSSSSSANYDHQTSIPPCFGSQSLNVAKTDSQSPTRSATPDSFQMFRAASARFASQGSGQIQLWQFLLELLSDSSNANCITWEGQNGEFKLIDPDEVARRWGERKSKPNMNYDKLSRALRYYYDKNIMTKVHGKRYAYKFDFHGLTQAQQPPSNEGSAAYRLQTELFLPHYRGNYLGTQPPAAVSLPPTVRSSYWSTGATGACNLYPNLSSHSLPHPGHRPNGLGPYYA